MPDDLNQLPTAPGNTDPAANPDPLNVPSDPIAPISTPPEPVIDQPINPISAPDSLPPESLPADPAALDPLPPVPEPALPPTPPLQDLPPLPEQPLPPQEPAPDLPPLPDPLFQNSGSAAPSFSDAQAAAAFVVPPNPKRKIPGKLLMGIAVILFLVASIPAGVFLVQQRQILQQRAAGEPSASIGGPSTGTMEDVAQNGAIQYSINVNGGTGIWRGELWVAKFEGSNIIPSSSWGCVNWGGQNLGDFCLINRVDFNPPVNAPTSYSGGFGPPQNGTYYVFPVVWGANNTHCTGSPWPASGEVSCGGSSKILLTVGTGGGGGGGNPPTATISGPATGTMGVGLTFNVNANAGSGNLSQGEIYIAKTDQSQASSWNCVNSDGTANSQYGIWCLLQRQDLNQPQQSYSGTWWAPQDGDYWVIANVKNAAGQKCTGTPLTLPSGWTACGSGSKTDIKIGAGGGATPTPTGGAAGLEITGFQQPNSPSTGDPITLKVQGKGALAKVYIHGSSAPTTGDGAPITTPWDPNKLVPNNKFWFVKQIDGANNVIDSNNSNVTFNAPGVAGKYYLVANAVSGSDICSWDGFKYTNGTKGAACTNVTGPSPTSFNVLGIVAAFTTKPTSGSVGQKLSFTAHATASPGNNRSLKKGEVWVTRKDKASFTCSSNTTNGPWCLLKNQDPLSGASADISADWTPTAAGLYYVTTTIFDDRSQCSGNPLVDFPWENPTTKVVYSNCGANSFVEVNIGGTAPQCLAISAYDTNWITITQNGLTQLKAGDKVRFAVRGQGTIDKARFKINNGAWQETTNKKDADEYWIEYTIPAGTLTFQIDAEVHDSGLNQWL